MVHLILWQFSTKIRGPVYKSQSSPGNKSTAIFLRALQ